MKALRAGAFLPVAHEVSAVHVTGDAFGPVGEKNVGGTDPYQDEPSVLDDHVFGDLDKQKLYIF